MRQCEDYTKLPKCITINLIGKGFNKNKRLHNKYLVLEQDTKEPLVSKLEIHILNLEKAKLSKECQFKDNKAKRLLNWLKFIETDDEEVREMLEQESPMMRKANTTIELMEMSPRDKWLYDSRQGIEEGIQQGLERGIDKGVYQKALETAKNLLAMNFPVENIAKVTGLSIKEVEAL